MADRGTELMLKGDKKTKKFFGGQSKYEDARELYLEAVVQFKKVQNWQGATEAIEKAIAMDVKLKDDMDRAAHLLEASKTSRKYDFAKAIGYIQDVLVHMEKQAQFARAAKLAEETAEMHREKYLGEEMSAEQVDSLVQWWDRACSYWKMERNATAHLNSCRQKIAELRLQQGKYQDAFEIFEDLGRQCADDAVMRFSARTHFFTALLCLLAQIEAAHKEEGADRFRTKFEEYQERDTQFTNMTQEHRFCTGIVAAFEEDDLKKFGETQKAYEKIMPLDKSRNLMVLRGKAALRSAEEDLC
eukprot:Hpha_TRINITY_DN15536_c1_g3::TRINITY_DN15536_c1_g3_i1::g.105782::m.105782/K15296/NAPA, SNAPA, SEC17; alpha-soluble NSF attachment protein